MNNWLLFYGFYESRQSVNQSIKWIVMLDRRFCSSKSNVIQCSMFFSRFSNWAWTDRFVSPLQYCSFMSHLDSDRFEPKILKMVFICIISGSKVSWHLNIHTRILPDDYYMEIFMCHAMFGAFSDLLCEKWQIAYGIAHSISLALIKVQKPQQPKTNYLVRATIEERLRSKTDNLFLEFVYFS